MKNVNLFQVIFYAANAASGLDASLDSRFDAGFSVDNFVCVDNSVDNCFDNSVNDGFDNSVDNGFDDTVDNSVNDGFDDTVDNSVNDGFDDRAN